MLSPGVLWIIVVIHSAQGYPYYNNFYNYRNYYQHRNPYNRFPDLELKRLKRCVNQWSPDMRMYNFMQNPSACGSSLVNDLSRITPEQLNCLMKILEGNEGCTNWPEGKNNSPSFQSGIPNSQSRGYMIPQKHPISPYKRSSKPPVLRPQAIHPSLLEGWVSDEDTNDLPDGAYGIFNHGVGQKQMNNIIQPEYARTQRQNPESLKAGSILVIVPGQDQIEEDMESQMAQSFYNPPPQVAPPPILQPPVMLPSHRSHSLMDINPIYSNSLPEGIPEQDDDSDSPEIEYQPLPEARSNILQGSPPTEDNQPPSMNKDNPTLASNIMHGKPDMTKDSPLQDPNILQGSPPKMGYEPLSIMPKDSSYQDSNNIYGKSQGRGSYVRPTNSNADPYWRSNIMNGNIPLIDYNSMNPNSLSGGLYTYPQYSGRPFGLNLNTPYMPNFPYFQNTQNIHPSIMRINSGLNCGPWANAWAMGMYPYTGPCFNPYVGLLGQRFDQLRAVTEAYKNVDEPEIEINQTTTCKKKGKDGKWVPCEPEDLERNLPSLYTNNDDNYNPTQVIPVWDGSMDKLAPELGSRVQSGLPPPSGRTYGQVNYNPTQVIPVWDGSMDKLALELGSRVQSGLPPSSGGTYGQVPTYTTGTPDPNAQGGGLLSGSANPSFSLGFGNIAFNYGQPVTGTPPNLTQMITPFTDPKIKSKKSISNSVYNEETNPGELVMNGGYTSTINPYNQGLVGNGEDKSNNVSPNEPDSAGRFKPSYVDYKPSYMPLNYAPVIGSERQGRIIYENMIQDDIFRTDRPGRSLEPPLQDQNNRYNKNFIMGQSNTPVFLPSQSIPAIPLYTGFNTMGDQPRSMNLMPYGQPIYLSQMTANRKHGQYPYIMNSPVAYGVNQNLVAPKWVPMQIDRSPQTSAADISKTESVEDSNIDDTSEIEESVEESDDY